MAAAWLKVVAFAANALFGLLGLDLDVFGGPSREEGSDSWVRIQLGLRHSDSGGGAPYIAAFNEKGEFVGYNDDTYDDEPLIIRAGSFLDFNIIQHSCKGCKPSQQAAYIQIFSYLDDICIAYIGQRWADGTPLGWLGDVAKVCDLPHYVSDIKIAKEDGGFHNPYCMWLYPLENGGDNPAAIQIHTPDYTATEGDDIPANDSLCHEPSFIVHTDARRDDDILPEIWGDLAPSKRSLSHRRNRVALRPPQDNSKFNGRLIGSHHEGHNATELCLDPMSWGPDFVSFYEGVYCDMTDRVTWPLCTQIRNTECYDWGSHSILYQGLGKREIGYQEVEEWA